MSWRTRKQKPNQGPKLSKIQYCSECGERMEPLMEIGREPDDWMWMECGICGDPICEKCSDFDDESGERICLICIQNQMIHQAMFDDSCPPIEA